MPSSPAVYELWLATSASDAFYPAVSKERHFLLGFILLLTALILTTVFALNRSIVTLPLLGIPASLAFGFGAVYMICAAGVYV